MRTCSDEGGLTQARHELHRAQDFGGEAELARWAERWGQGLLDRELVEDDAWHPILDAVDDALSKAVIKLEEVLDMVENKAIDLSAMHSATTAALEALRLAETEVEKL